MADEPGKTDVTNDSDGKSKDVQSFTPEQQAKIDEIRDRAYSNGLSKTAAELKAERERAAELEKKLAEVEARLNGDGDADDGDDDNGKGDKGKADDAKAEALREGYEKKIQDLERKRQTEAEKLSAELGALRNARKFDALVNAARSFNVHDDAPEVIARQLTDRVLVDANGALVVMREDGKSEAYDDKGEPMKVSQLVEEFLAPRSYFVKPGPAGGGSRGAVGGGKSPTFTREQIKAMSPEEFKKNKDAIMAAANAGMVK